MHKIYNTISVSMLVLTQHRLQAGAMLHSRSFNNDEINSVSAAPNGRFLAAADDAGDVKVIDASTWQLFKSMRGAHDNICSSAVFRSLLQLSVYSPFVDLCWLQTLALRLLKNILILVSVPTSSIV